MSFKIKGSLSLLLGLAALGYLGWVFRSEGFSMRLAELLLVGVVAVATLFLIGFRCLGSLPAWIGLGLGLPACLVASGDVGTAIFIYAACCGAPWAVSLFWPGFKKIRSLTMAALPAAGGIWLGGALLYSKLHFGSWSISCITRQISFRYLGELSKLEILYRRLYEGEAPAELDEMFALLRSVSSEIGFGGIMLAAYILFGSFFIGVWLADRLGSEERWLGSWSELIPSRGLAWVYVGSMLLLFILPQQSTQALQGVLNIFGFLFVFSGVYALLQGMRKKNFKPFWRFLWCLILFAMALFSTGGGILAPYTLLVIFGMFKALSPKVKK